MSLLPNSPEVRKKLNDAIQECVDSKVRAQAESTFQTETAARIEEEIGVSKGEFKKRVAIRHKQETNPTAYNDDKEWYDSVFEENEMLRKVK